MSKFSTVAAEIGVLVTEKNIAYGDSFAKCGDFLRLLWPNGIGPEQYGDALAMVRIFDKQMRIAAAKDALGESPYRDIAGYGILGAVKDAAERGALANVAAHKAPSLCDSEVDEWIKRDLCRRCKAQCAFAGIERHVGLCASYHGDVNVP